MWARAVTALFLLLLCGTMQAAFGQGARGAVAQTPQDPTPRFSTAVVVTPERGETPRHLVPAATAVMDGARLDALPAVQLSELLAHLPGFQIREDHPFSSRPLITSRGFFGGGEAEYVLVLVDGVPISDPESGLIDWSRVSMASVRRIEAFRGPGGSLYGDSAIGGVIQVFTDARPPGTRLTASAGSFGTFTGDVAHGGEVPIGRYAVTGSGTRSDGPSEHSSLWRLIGAASLEGASGATAWRLAVTGSGREADEPGPRTDPELLSDRFGSNALFRFDGLDRRNLAVAFSVGSTGERWDYRARAYGGTRRDDLVRTILLVPGLGDRQSRRLSTSEGGFTLEGGRDLAWQSRLVTVRGGVDVVRHGVDTAYRRVDDSGIDAPGSPANARSGHRWRSGAFGSAAWELTSRLRLSTGVRWDLVTDDFGASSALTRSHRAWSPRVGLTLQLEPGVTVFGQASRAFKAPTTDQLFDPRPYPDFAGGSFTISNSGLEPQRATTLEAGARGGRRLQWSALAYRMQMEDEIDFARLPTR